MTTIGITAGAFDLLHAGHCLMLKEISEQCDYLIIALQYDPSMDRSYKNKPIQSLEERSIQIESTRYVNEIIVYDLERDLYSLLETLIEKYKDHRLIRFIGEDWRGKEYTGKDLPVEVIFNSRDHSYSTSELRKRIVKYEFENLSDEMEKMIKEAMSCNVNKIFKEIRRE